MTTDSLPQLAERFLMMMKMSVPALEVTPTENVAWHFSSARDHLFVPIWDWPERRKFIRVVRALAKAGVRDPKEAMKAVRIYVLLTHHPKTYTALSKPAR